MKSYKEIMNDITTFIFDVDGVLTDGMVHVTPEGEILRHMNIRDGFAIKAALESGYNVCIISGGKNEGVRIRLRNLGVTDIYLGSPDKVETFKEYTDIYGIKPEQVLYMGDDIPDYHVMQLVGLPTCPQDASPEIKAISNYISHVNGGKGAARGKWNTYFDGKHD
jgi:3-deoxy-D-manno-octulosonate 8-phosphate phosphatase (KDO 8-P phosphatase)